MCESYCMESQELAMHVSAWTAPKEITEPSDLKSKKKDIT